MTKRKHLGPEHYPQAACKRQHRNERAQARRISQKLIEMCCPFGLDDYEQARDWYATARLAIQAEYGDDWRIACGLIAATSPQVDVRQNGKLARQAYDAWKAGTLDEHRHWLPCHGPNSERACRMEPLSGQKVEAFRRALLGEDAIVVDTWMLRAAGFDEATVRRSCSRAIRVTHEAVRLAAAATGLGGCEAQAVIWTVYRAAAWTKKNQTAGDGALVV